jgi:NAD(P)-dependent dehydrogenase (short-subunit alcohol dehydrogenase family)
MTLMRFAGQCVIVTGASRGMGRAIAEAFASEGARLALWGRTRKTLEKAAADIGGDAFAITCDMGNARHVEQAFTTTLERAGQVHVLVNNAGISGDAVPFLDMTEEAWDGMMAVNLKGAMLASRLAARHMAERGGGVILHNASIAASAADGAFSHYSASKAGLLALMRSMAVELAAHNIRVNAVSPGYTRTDMTMQFFPEDQHEFLTRRFRRAPANRIVEVEEVASAFVFLASREASGITGINLVVDGGLTANHFIMETFPGSDAS